MGRHICTFGNGHRHRASVLIVTILWLHTVLMFYAFWAQDHRLLLHTFTHIKFNRQYETQCLLAVKYAIQSQSTFPTTITIDDRVIRIKTGVRAHTYNCYDTKDRRYTCTISLDD